MNRRSEASGLNTSENCQKEKQAENDTDEDNPALNRSNLIAYFSQLVILFYGRFIDQLFCNGLLLRHSFRI